MEFTAENPPTEENLRKFANASAAIIAPVFEAHGWTWGGTGVPSAAEIAKVILDLLRKGLADTSGLETVTVTRGRIQVDVLLEYQAAHVSLNMTDLFWSRE